MQSYSPQELERMQKQAIDRVHEMQRQAKMGSPENRQNTSGTKQQHYTQSVDNSARKTPVQPNAPPPAESAAHETNAAHKKQKEQEPPKPPTITRVHKTSQALPFLSMDSDTALILPLILLLQRDGADEMLILALLYIMS